MNMIIVLMFAMLHTLFGAAMSISSIGLIVDLLCYLFGKDIIFPVMPCVWLLVIGFVLEVINTTACSFFFFGRE